MKNKLLLSITGLLLISPLHAGSSSKGTTSAAFLQLGADARSVAMGEAAVASTNDAAALYWNPAALNRISSRSVTFMHAVYLDSSKFNYTSYGQKISAKNSLAIGIQYFSYGDIGGTDTSGASSGDISPRDLAASIGYAHDIEGYSAGVSLKFIQSKLVNTADTWAMDAGLLTPLMMNGKTRFAATVSNLGGKLKYDREDEDLPLTFKIGSAINLKKNWLVSVDAGMPKSNSAYLALGTEARVRPEDGITVALRGGYNTNVASDLDGIGGLTAGLGFAFKKFALDYALMPFGDLGLTHRLSLSSNF